MKMTIGVGELRSALQTVTMSLPGKSPTPILECVLIEVEDEFLTITCSDGTMQVTRRLPCEVEEIGRCAVRGKMFDDIIKKMPEGNVVIATDPKGERIVIRCGKVRSQVSCMDADLFPLKEEFEPTSSVKIMSSCIADMISDTESCIARADMREVLTGGCVDVDHGVVRMVALDGFRMAVKGYRCSVADDMRAILPIRTLAALKKILGAYGDEVVEMQFNDSEFRLQFGSATIQCTLIAGTYVEWRKIIPPQFATEVTVDATQFRQAIERAYIVASSGAANNLVRLDISEDAMNISAQSNLDDMYESIDVICSGQPIKIAFNVKYLYELLKVFSAGEICLKMVSGVSPCVVEFADKASDVEDFFWLILPVRQSAGPQ